VLDQRVGGRLDCRLGHRIGLEEREVTFPPDSRPGLVSREIGRYREDPGSRLLRAVGQGPDEHLLRQIFGTLGVPNLAVQEAHDGRVGGLVQLFEVVRHSVSSGPAR
jgi:hypothetical protein